MTRPDPDPHRLATLNLERRRLALAQLIPSEAELNLHALAGTRTDLPPGLPRALRRLSQDLASDLSTNPDPHVWFEAMSQRHEPPFGPLQRALLTGALAQALPREDEAEAPLSAQGSLRRQDLLAWWLLLAPELCALGAEAALGLSEGAPVIYPKIVDPGTPRGPNPGALMSEWSALRHRRRAQSLSGKAGWAEQLVWPGGTPRSGVQLPLEAISAALNEHWHWPGHTPWLNSYPNQIKGLLSGGQLWIVVGSLALSPTAFNNNVYRLMRLQAEPASGLLAWVTAQLRRGSVGTVSLATLYGLLDRSWHCAARADRAAL